MENAELIGLTRQTALKRKLDVVANNLANLNTAGFKSQNLLFEEYMMPVAELSEFPTLDKPLSYVHDFTSFRDMSEGGVTMTGNPLDVAVAGKGWFVVQTADGERFTRSGNFQINQAGELVTMDGKQVLGDGGPIVFAPEETDVSIAKDGTVSTNEGVRGRLRVVSFADEQAMSHVGNNLFNGENPLPIETPKVIQGALEGSNVHGVVEMTRMIDITRSYQVVAQMMKDQDDLMSRAVSTLGNVEA